MREVPTVSNRSPRVIVCMKTYLKAKNAQRRAAAKAANRCQHCNSDPARPGMATCEPCGFADALRHRKTA